MICAFVEYQNINRQARFIFEDRVSYYLQTQYSEEVSLIVLPVCFPQNLKVN